MGSQKQDAEEVVQYRAEQQSSAAARGLRRPGRGQLGRRLGAARREGRSLRRGGLAGEARRRGVAPSVGERAQVA